MGLGENRRNPRRMARGHCERCERDWVAPSASALKLVIEAHTSPLPGREYSECDRVLHPPSGVCPSPSGSCQRCSRKQAG